MAILKANLCVNCRTPTGYIIEEALEMPTLCIICVTDPEIMGEWEHEVSPREKDPLDILSYYVLKGREALKGIEGGAHRAVTSEKLKKE